jgi:hypothetical protein
MVLGGMLKKKALVIMAILVASIATTVSPLYYDFQYAAGQSGSAPFFYIPGTNSPALNGTARLFFITATGYNIGTSSYDFANFILEVKGSDPNGSVIINHSQLPPGASYNNETSQLLWPGSAIKKFMQHSAMSPKFLGVTFTASQGGEHVEIFIQIAVENIKPPVTVELDKPAYYLGGDTATITVRDFHARKNATSSNTIQVAVKSFGFVPGSGSGDIFVTNVPLAPFSESRIVNLREVKSEPGVPVGTFRGNLSLVEYSPSASANSLRVANGGLLTASYNATGVPLSLSQVIASSAIDSVSIELVSGSKYAINDTTTVTIKDRGTKSDNSVNKVNLLVMSSSGGVFTTQVVETGSSTGILKGTVPFIKQGGDPSIPNQVANALKTNVGDEVVFLYKGRIAKAIIAPAVDAIFDKIAYNVTDRAMITVNDVHMNKDRWKQDILNVKVNSSTDSTGFNVTLREDSINSGIFREMDYVNFNKTSNPQSLTLAVNEPVDTITASYVFQSGNMLSEIGYSVQVHDVNWTRDLEAGGIGEAGGSGTAWGTITGGSPTNLSCSTRGGDTDGDGACDNWELAGTLDIDYGGSTYSFDYNCNPVCVDPSRPDILLEIDYFGTAPNAAVLSDIITYFDNNGYTLHIDATEAVPAIADNILNVWKDPTTDNTTALDSYKEVKESYFGHDASARYTTNKGKAQREVYHYMLFGTTIKQHYDLGSSGYGEIIGNDAVVSLGSFTDLSPYNKQKGTIMHELGHNLGLNHGGGTSSLSPVTWIPDYKTNCKPNYLSPMSYTRQFPNPLNLLPSDLTGWSASYSTGDKLLHMSGSNSDLDNDVLNETDGLKTASAVIGDIQIAWGITSGGSRIYAWKILQPSFIDPNDNINWDGDGSSTETSVDLPDLDRLVDTNIGGCRDTNSKNVSFGGYTPDSGIITDFNDWTHLVPNFRLYGTGTFGSGASFQPIDPALVELNYATWIEILVESIRSLNYTVQTWNDGAFVDAEHDKPAIASALEKVIAFIQRDDMPSAVNELSMIRKQVDEAINDQMAKGDILRFLDSNMLILATEIDPNKGDTFTLTSHHDGKTFVVVGNSSTVKPLSDTFTINPGLSLSDIKLNGIGDVTLRLEFNLINSGEMLDSHNTNVSVNSDNVTASFSSLDNTFLNQTITFSTTDMGNDVEIISARVIPEFPLISTLTLALSMMAVIVFALALREHGKGLSFYRS